jgi:hypothetical protein
MEQSLLEKLLKFSANQDISALYENKSSLQTNADPYPAPN